MRTPPTAALSAGLPIARRGDMRLSRVARWLALIAVVLAMAVLARSSGLRPRLASVGTQLSPWIDRSAAAVGFGLDQVEIAGIHQASAREILDAVDLPNVRTFLALDVAAVKARIERVAWIDTARIDRHFPNILAITVTERRPLAAWDRGPSDALVDRTGRQLATVARAAVPDLPRIAGEGAPQDVGRLFDLIAAYPEIRQRLTLAERVGGRRWRLHLSGGLRIELPVEADAAALAILMETRPAGRLFDVAAASIDLTLLRRIVIEPLPAAPGGR